MSAAADRRRSCGAAQRRQARAAAARKAAQDDQRVVEALLQRTARTFMCDWKAAIAGRRPVEIKARHAVWRELATARRWSASRIARAFNTDHTSILYALKKPAGCPVCGDMFDETTEAPLSMMAGVETQRAYRHPGRVCIVRAAFVLRGESEAA